MADDLDWLNGLFAQTGPVSLAGDVQGPNNTNVVAKLQGIPVSATPPSLQQTPSVLSYDGNSYKSTGAPQLTIYGQAQLVNYAPFSVSWTACHDNTPDVAAWVAANPYGGTLRLVNPIFKTRLDLSALLGTQSHIEIEGLCLVATNVGELVLPVGVSLSGRGGGAYSGSGETVSGPLIAMIAVNSAGGYGPEPNCSSTAASLTGPFQYYVMQTAAPLSTAAIGNTLTISAASNSAFVGCAFKVIASYVDPVNSLNIVRMVYVSGGSGAPTNATSTGISWSVPGFPSGASAQVTKIAQNCVRVTGHRGLDPLTSWRGWMSTSGCAQSLANAKLWRILGADSSTSCYLHGGNVYAASTPISLPDANNGAISSYEARPMVQLSYNNTVRNIQALTPNPGFCIDGNPYGSQYCELINCAAAAGSSSYKTAVPCIVDGGFWFNLEKCLFGNGFANLWGSIYFTVTDRQHGQYAGLAKVSECTTDNGSIFVAYEEPADRSGVITFSKYINEIGRAYPGTSYHALVIHDNSVAGIRNYRFTDSGYADNAVSPSYLYETLYPSIPATSPPCFNLSVDSTGGFSTFLGPNAANLGVDIRIDNLNNFNQTDVGNTSAFQAYDIGLTDAALVGGGDDFSPVVTLPYQVPLGNLYTVADWTALTGAANVSGTNADGYPIIGPDMVQANMIRVYGTGIAGAVKYFSFTKTLAVGDVFVVMCRVQHLGANTDPSQVILDVGAATGNILNATSFQFAAWQTSGPTPWQDVCAMAKVTATSGSPQACKLIFGCNASLANDSSMNVDPESIAVLYIPASTAGVEAISPREVVRLSRKIRRQIPGATPGDVALPARTGLSLGPVARPAFTANAVTASTNPEVAYSWTVPAETGFVFVSEWTALDTTALGSGYFSAGQFRISGFCHSGAITLNTLRTLGTDDNTGAGGAAASTPISVTSSGAQVSVKVTSQRANNTVWQLTNRLTSNIGHSTNVVLPPMLTALAYPFLAPAAGGGVAVSLQGSSLTQVTGVTVNGVAATGVSSTATSVTFNWPANTASATPYNIVVTTTIGTATLTSAVYYLPASVTYAWYAGFGFNQATAAWTDLIAGVMATVGSGTLPTFVANWTHGMPAIRWQGAGYGRARAAFTSIAQPFELGVIGDASNSGGFIDSFDTHNTLLYAGGAGTNLTGYTGASIATTDSLTSPFLGSCYFSGASSYVLFNNAKTTGSLSTANLSNGVTISDQEQVGVELNGHIGLAVVMTSPVTADETVLHGISQALFGTP